MKALYEQIANELKAIEGVKIVDLHNSKLETVGESAILPLISIEIDIDYQEETSLNLLSAESRVIVRIYQENFANTDITSPQKDRGLRIFDLVELVKATIKAMSFTGEKKLTKEYLDANQTNVYLNILEYDFNFTQRLC